MSARAGTCGCCAGIHVETPRLVVNRAGLSAIAYRTGDHGSFKRSMLAAISGRLPALTSRNDDDFSIALLDAWATTSDVLTFYQERIANESFLRTAGERLSVLELARLIDYQLAPGVAAGVWLAFTVDDAQGSPRQVKVDSGSRVQSVPGQNEEPQTFETSIALDARAEWNDLRPRVTKPHPVAVNDTFTFLAGTSTNLSVGDGLLFFKDNVNWDFRRVINVAPDFDQKRTQVFWSGGLPANVANATIFAMRVKTALFGHNAPDPRALPADTRTQFSSDIISFPGPKRWRYPIAGGQIFLDGADARIRTGTHVVLINPAGVLARHTVSSANEITRNAFAMSGKSMSVVLQGAPSLGSFAGGSYRGTTVFAASEALTRADHPISGAMAQPIELDRAMPAFEENRAILVRGRLLGSSDVISELAFVKSIADASSAHPKLQLTRALTNTFEVTSVRIAANVAPATHGETVREVLGSGDAAVPFQRFRLAQKPLTYISSEAGPSGAVTTLVVYVNDVKWREVPTLFGAGPNARVYVTRRDDDGKTTVEFGDGKTTGARLPTGDHNVRAVYRKGIGFGGNAGPGKITLLMSRPLGLKEVDNPRAAAGGDDPQVLADARTNAPRTVLTLDRVVSLLDYQAFAASFAGIAKAIATWTWSGTARQLFLTVAAPHGVPFPPDSTTLSSLAGALVRHGDPHVPLEIASYHRAWFLLVAKVGVDKDRVAEQVLQKVRAAVRDAFAFEARSFGEAVDLSDLVKVIHSVAGVASVDVDYLFRVGQAFSRQERLTAAMPRRMPDGTLRPAEILVLAAAFITEAK